VHSPETPAAARVVVTLAAFAGDEATVRSGLSHAEFRVRAAALSGLDRCGALTANDVLAGLADPEMSVRRRAIELAGSPGREWSTDIDRSLIAIVQGTDAVLAEVAAWCLGERFEATPEPKIDDEDDFNLDDPAVDAEDAMYASVIERYSIRTEAIRALTDAVMSHDDALVREAAVAALGSIGDESGKPAVLHALHDKATVRRRAVIALAAFEGDDVNEALTTATGDRDWQVRQAAEDLL
jgi:HEAT repeat protein